MSENQYFEKEREKYRPKDIKLLIIAEAPPRIESGRFFYFLDVGEQDSLFLEVMKVFYSQYFKEYTIPQIRNIKSELLSRFKDDGFYLIDAVNQPMLENNSSYKKGRIKASLSELKDKIDRLVDKKTPIILISKNVYDVCYKELSKSGYKILNNEMIDFPGSGRQRQFRKKFEELVKILGNKGN